MDQTRRAVRVALPEKSLTDARNIQNVISARHPLGQAWGPCFLVHAAAGLALVAPLLVDTYWINEVSRFLIFALAGLGLMIVTGYTGQVSLGHAAFLAVGAYAHTYFISHEMPFVISLLLAAFISGCVGWWWLCPPAE